MVALANVDTTYDGPLLLCMDDHRLKHVTASCFHFVGISRSACKARTSKYCIFRGKGVRYIHTTNYFAIDEIDESRLWICYVVICARPYLRGMALPYLLMTGWLCRQGFVCVAWSHLLARASPLHVLGAVTILFPNISTLEVMDLVAITMQGPWLP